MMRRSALYLQVLLLCTMMVNAVETSTVLHQTVTLYIDNQVVDFQSTVIDEKIPTYVVNGTAMVPLRLLDEELGYEIHLHMMRWKIFQIQENAQSASLMYSFKVGDKSAVKPEPAIGGSLAGGGFLSAAPLIINGRVYVPARSILTLFGQTVTWNPDTHSLIIMRKNEK